MKRIILYAVLFCVGLSLNAQEKLPRFYWATMYDTLDVTISSMDEMRQAIDSIDFTTVTEEELEFLEKHFDPFQKRWMAVYGKAPASFDQATTIIAGGIICNKCEELITAEIESVENVIKVLSIDTEKSEIIFSFEGESYSAISSVMSTLDENLKECGYFFREYHEKETDEVQLKLGELKEQKKLILKKGCKNH